MAAPFLRWAGSKKQLLERLVAYWPGHQARYIEPFAGSARLFFRLEPREAILGDINTGLVEVYQVVRDDPGTLFKVMSTWETGPEEYYRLRGVRPNSLDLPARAARFIYLNRYCFNGLYRTNRRGHFNVPYGGHPSSRLPTLQELKDAGSLLSRATLVAADFGQVIEMVNPGDFVYLDPPFSVRNRRVFRQYDPASFGHSDLSRMRKALEHIDAIGATFLLSYAKSDEGSTLARGYHRRVVSAHRHIAGFARHRSTASELLVTNRQLTDASSDGVA